MSEHYASTSAPTDGRPRHTGRSARARYSPARTFMRRLIGDTTLDIGPGDWISIAARLVARDGGRGEGGQAGVKVRVGSGVSVGNSVGRSAVGSQWPKSLATWAMASARSTRQPSAGIQAEKASGRELEVGEAQPAKSPRREYAKE
ncbi:MAG: hypothetical protein MZV63_07115 [Marinilabiliales bacterium]|nr:hypothetical protein [Marinilabiliales bacterium]